MARSGTPTQNPAALLQEALALHQRGRLDEAERIYNRVLKLDRRQFDALHLLGVLNQQRGKAGEAYRLLTAALAIQPKSPDALAHMGMVLHSLKRSDEALQSFERALTIAPDHPDALLDRGTVRLALGQAGEALSDFDRVLARQPGHLVARINRGNVLGQLDRHQEALAEFDAALAIHANHPAALYNRGTALHALGRAPEAIIAFDRALALVPRHVGAWYNRGLALQSLNRHREAIESFRKVREIAPDHGDAGYAEAASLLTLGDYRAGFEAYEWRWKRGGMPARSRMRQPLWRGDRPLAGRTILLQAEQGLGDTIQFARYVPELARSGAKVVLDVQPELTDLLSGLDGASAVVARGGALPPYDFHCPLASLPMVLRTERETVPAPIPYLRANEMARDAWRPRLESLAGLRVALAWSGRASHANDRNRSLTFDQIKTLLSVPGVSFVSVQRDLRAGDAERLASESRILHLGDDLTDFVQTAAVLSLVDLVISVDTAVAHLAGALGRPLWVLLPFQPDWRWTLDGDCTPWYPEAQLLRQPSPGGWGAILSYASEMLASRAQPVT